MVNTLWLLMILWSNTVTCLCCDSRLEGSMSGGLEEMNPSKSRRGSCIPAPAPPSQWPGPLKRGARIPVVLAWKRAGMDLQFSIGTPAARSSGS
jgi:hypothetical protein